MSKENRPAGLGEAMESESEPDTESDDKQIMDEGTTNKSEKSEPEPVVKLESEGDFASDSKAESDPEPDEVGESGDVGEGSEAAERNDGGEAEEATEPNVEADGAESVTDMEQTTETAGGPAFEFEATTAKSVYVRTAMLDRPDDVEFEIESFLHREHDVRDLTGRKFYDAFVRAAIEHPEKIVDAVLEHHNE